MGQVVCITDNRGQKHIGRITKVDREMVWIMPYQGRGGRGSRGGYGLGFWGFGGGEFWNWYCTWNNIRNCTCKSISLVNMKWG
ncbi:hypothetical protein [Ureibacillus acetophenoni]